MVEGEFVRIVTIPLRDVWDRPRTSRAPGAVHVVRTYLARHFKVDPADVIISTPLNELIWKDGRHHIPRRLKVKVTKFLETRHLEAEPYDERREAKAAAARDSAAAKGTDEASEEPEEG